MGWVKPLLMLGLPDNVAFAVASALILGLCVAMVLLRRCNSAANAPRAKTLASAVSRPSVELTSSDKPLVRILYGTQTGTAERFSKQLATELRKRHGDGVAVQVLDLENYKAEVRLRQENLVVFAVATYGDGEPTDNAAEFYAWLVKEVEAVETGTKEPSLLGVSYAVFGLGNKQYEHFNSVGKRVHSGLLALGAKPVVRRGDGDDDGCIDDDFDKWCAELHIALNHSDILGHSNQNGDTTSNSNSNAELEVAAYDFELVPSGTKEVQPFPSGTGASASSPFWATVTALRELHGATSGRSCVHVELDVKGAAGAWYEAGDHVAIYSQNQPAVVDEVAAALGITPDTLFVLKSPAGVSRTAIVSSAGEDAAADSSTLGHGLAEPLPGPLSLRTALAYFADVLSMPHREALLALAACAQSPEDATRLKWLASLEGRQEYQEFIHKPHRSLLEVLRAFPSCKPSLGVFFGSIAPRPQPRFYSISSSPKAHPSSIHVTCAVVRELTPTGRTHEGLCSTWLARHAAVGSRLPVYVRHSHFRLPADPATPVVMVGPGTGLAPFRGFLQERAALAKSGASLGPCHLFFGCRNRQQDFIYEGELMGHLRNGVLSSLHVAFSRDGPSKDYVQHHLAREGAAVWPLLAAPSRGHLYVCGDAKQMAKDVHRALVALAQAQAGCTAGQAELLIKEMQDGGRYQRDVW